MKIAGISLGVLAVLLIAFHFWFIHHAKALLEETVDKKSNGRIKLKIEKLHYNYFTQKMVLDHAVFYTTDTLTAPSSYRFDIPELRLTLNGLMPLVLNKKLLIDSLYLQSPLIQVTTLRYTKDTLNKKEEKISIPYEMGKVYKSIQDALKVLKVNRFQLEDGKFILTNKVEPGQIPLVISNLHFQIDNLQVDPGVSAASEKLLFSDNVTLRCTDQHIVFPDGRHRLSFNRFRINLQRRLVEFDSCTIEATKKDSSGSSFKVFFDVLLLTNIDFDTLYRTEVIKADSVYCVNPRFTLDVETGKTKGLKKNPPKLERIIEQLTGDLQLGYVVVANADFDIRTTRNGKPSSFTFSNNNFEMQGLSVDQQADKPIRVKSFAMAIRNYENFIKDSSYSVKFDSVIFKDDRITLSNFLFNKLNNGKITNTFSVPRFSLEGLSWDYLVFEKKLKARLATMYEPHISYTAGGRQGQKQAGQSIFHSLGAVNDYMDLDQLDIENGNIDLTLKDNIRVQLDNADLSIQSHSLLSSTRLAGIKNSLTSLNVEKGKIQAGNLSISIQGIRYAGGQGKFAASMVTISDKEKTVDATVKDVNIEKLFIDEAKGNILASGVQWRQADINIRSASAKKRAGLTIDLNDVHGLNTDIHTQAGGKTLSTTLKDISFSSFKLSPGQKPLISGLFATGHHLELSNPEMHLSVKEFSVKDKSSSFFGQLHYTANTSKITADISAPFLSATPDVQAILEGNMQLDEITLTRPVINLHQASLPAYPAEKKNSILVINSSMLLLKDPEINFTRQTDSGTVSFRWFGQKGNGNFLQADGLHTRHDEGAALSINKLSFSLTDLLFTNSKGKSLSTGKGKVDAVLKDIHYIQKEDDNPEWEARLSNLTARDFRLDSMGGLKGKLAIQHVMVKDLQLNSGSIIKLQSLVAANPDFQIAGFTGQYHTMAHQFEWSNAGFSRSNNLFSLDTFSFQPSLSIDSFLATKKFQTDYIRAGTGALKIGPVDIDRYIRDTVLVIKNAVIRNAYLFDYKDKNLPFNTGLIKPLPVNLLKKIPVKLDVDSLTLTNAAVEYTEVNEKKATGTIPVTRMTVSIRNIKNHRPLYKDSLRIKASGYMFDTVWVRLQVNESYTDSLGGFLMTLRLKPGDLRVLNTVLIPLASVKILSGELDTLEMRAVGREYLSLGEMKMFYKNLKIQLLKDGKEGKQPFFTRLLSLAANAFIIRSKNTSRTGNVFFVRQRDKSAINYLIKIAISGMSSSVGARSNKKMIRKYKKELEKRKLPPIDLE